VTKKRQPNNGAGGQPAWTYAVAAIVAAVGLVWGIVSHFIPKPAPSARSNGPYDAAAPSRRRLRQRPRRHRDDERGHDRRAQPAVDPTRHGRDVDRAAEARAALIRAVVTIGARADVVCCETLRSW
jgi:hypothetical protein